MPPQQKTRIEDLRLQPPPPRPVARDETRRFLSVAGGAGTEILISFLPLPWVPRRMSWMARITEFVWNSHFCDEQVRGPFAAFRHRHGIEAAHQDGLEGTLVSDEIEFSLPWGAISRFGGIFVKRELSRAFAHRQKRLPEILAIAARQATRRA
jgi:ligand-binding SRPBCC domain-containing protein